MLISGSGSNLGALIGHIDSINLEIVCVISNQAGVYGLVRASQAGIVNKVVKSSGLSREDFEDKLAQTIDKYQPEIIILAGFMRILTTQFTQRYLGKILNIHPSLLPKFKGLNTHQRAIEAGEKTHGVSVHFVSPDLDSGAIIAQKTVAIDPNDTAKSLAKKVLAQEHLLYPCVIKWFVQGRLVLKNGLAYLDNQIITTPKICE